MRSTYRFDARLSQTPELKYGQSGSAYINLSWADSDSYQNKQTGEWVNNSTTWCSLTFFGDQAEEIAARFPEKGDRVVGEARLAGIRTYQKNDGGMGATLNLKGWPSDVMFTKWERSGSGGSQPVVRPAGSTVVAPPVEEGAPAPLAAADDFEVGEDLPW